MREADFAKAKTLETRGEKPPTVEDTLYYDLLDAYRKNDVARQDKLRATIDRERQKAAKPKAGDERWPLDFRLTYGLITSGDIEDAHKVGTSFAALQLPPKRRDGSVRLQSFLNDVRGRRRAARALALSIGTAEQQLDYEVRATFPPFVQTPAEKLLELRAAVAKGDSTAGQGNDPAAVLRPHFRLYNLALLNCQLGNTAEALQQARRMETLGTPPYWAEAIRALATDVRAFADLRNGDVKQALSRIESIPIDVPLDLLYTDAGRLNELFWRGELLYRAGRYDEALPWFENSLHANGGMNALTPFYLLRRAQIYDRKGDTRQASSFYAQVLMYWKDADPELQPMVQEARNRLAVLQRKVD